MFELFEGLAGFLFLNPNKLFDGHLWVTECYHWNMSLLGDRSYCE